jgi:hypothetical protein
LLLGVHTGNHIPETDDGPVDTGETPRVATVRPHIVDINLPIGSATDEDLQLRFIEDMQPGFVNHLPQASRKRFRLLLDPVDYVILSDKAYTNDEAT